MAKLRIEVGSLSSEVEASNAKAQEVLALFFAGRHGDDALSAQEQLDYIVGELVSTLLVEARAQKRVELLRAAQQQAVTEGAALEWTA